MCVTSVLLQRGCVCTWLHVLVDLMGISACIFSDSTYVQNGYRPLYIASATGHTEVVDVLLNSGADLKLAIMVWRLVCSFHLLHWGKNC